MSLLVQGDRIPVFGLPKVNTQIGQLDNGSVDLDFLGLDDPTFTFFLVDPACNTQVAVKPGVPEATSLWGHRELVHIERWTLE